MPNYKFLVIGGGLAGVFAAYHLSERGSTAIAERKRLGAEASGAAVGLVNPFMGRKAKTTWRYEEALDGLEKVVASSGAESLLHRTGIWRPAVSEKQAGFFAETAASHPGRTNFVDAHVCKERYPQVAMPYGALEIHPGSWTDIPLLLRHLIADAERRNKLECHLACELTGWSEEAGRVIARFEDGRELTAAHLIIAAGFGVHRLPALERLDLHHVKGQAIRISVDASYGASLPCMSGPAHIIPVKDALGIGSTYEHTFTHLDPTPEGTKTILEKASMLLPGLRPNGVEWEAAGARVTVPRTRLPMVDRVPSSNRVWVFTGLGTKGILMAALLSKELPGYLLEGKEIPGEIRLRINDADTR